MARKRVELSPIDRSIRSRERGIERMRANIERIRQQAAEQITEIERKIQEKQILLDALRRGTLKQ